MHHSVSVKRGKCYWAQSVLIMSRLRAKALPKRFLANIQDLQRKSLDTLCIHIRTFKRLTQVTGRTSEGAQFISRSCPPLQSSCRSPESLPHAPPGLYWHVPEQGRPQLNAGTKMLYIEHLKWLESFAARRTYDCSMHRMNWSIPKYWIFTSPLIVIVSKRSLQTSS